MENFYNNLIFVNKYLKERRKRYNSVYRGKYREKDITISFLKDYIEVKLCNKQKKFSETIYVNNNKCLNTVLDNI